MTEEKCQEFDAGEYWRQRVATDADLATVGHRSMGVAYNSQIYARRIEALDECLATYVSRPLSSLRVLDVGCGSGFYVDYWRSKRVSEYVGIDISPGSVASLGARYPDRRFAEADLTSDLSGLATELGGFDIVTVFDVLYHIVDDRGFATAVENIASLTAPAGTVFIMDQLHRRRYQISKHVVYRDEAEYLAEFLAAGLRLEGRELLFQFLVPPITGFRPLDFLSAGLFAATGGILSRGDSLSSKFASAVRRIDAHLSGRLTRLRNSELLTFSMEKCDG